ncbi:MAG TPA: TraB/GumN family protein [Spirochaetia bacterium]|nr:TraB/GumN family protein [Spirochaetia bacterium]
MTESKTTDSITRLQLGEREIIILGTAHISQESAEEVRSVIAAENPDRVCIEIDESRYRSLKQDASWRNLNISRVLRDGKGFLLLSNLVLASFQKRMGLELGIRPGEEMLAAITAAEERGIPFSFCDREIQITLKRAWASSSLWGKNKMLAAMLSSIFTNEKLSREEIENLKKTSALQGMLEELAGFLPSVKEVLIDERDTYLATTVYQAEGKRLVAVVGAGHVPGMVQKLRELDAGNRSMDLDFLEVIPKKSLMARTLPWLLPLAIIGAVIAGFLLRGSAITFNNLVKWIIVNGTLASLGSVIALANPLTILVAFIAAPITSLIPVIGVGLFTGLTEAALKKPRVLDFENLNQDLASLKGFYRNRVTHVLVVFFLSSIGSSIGTFIGGIPLFTSLFGG